MLDTNRPGFPFFNSLCILNIQTSEYEYLMPFSSNLHNMMDVQHMETMLRMCLMNDNHLQFIMVRRMTTNIYAKKISECSLTLIKLN